MMSGDRASLVARLTWEASMAMLAGAGGAGLLGGGKTPYLVLGEAERFALAWIRAFCPHLEAPAPVVADPVSRAALCVVCGIRPRAEFVDEVADRCLACLAPNAVNPIRPRCACGALLLDNGGCSGEGHGSC